MSADDSVSAHFLLYFRAFQLLLPVVAVFACFGPGHGPYGPHDVAAKLAKNITVVI